MTRTAILLTLVLVACSRGDATDTPKTSGKRGHGGNPVEVAPLESKQTLEHTILSFRGARKTRVG